MAGQWHTHTRTGEMSPSPCQGRAQRPQPGGCVPLVPADTEGTANPPCSYLPAFVMIISVPTSWNFSHSSRSCKNTLMPSMPCGAGRHRASAPGGTGTAPGRTGTAWSRAGTASRRRGYSQEERGQSREEPGQPHRSSGLLTAPREARRGKAGLCGPELGAFPGKPCPKGGQRRLAGRLREGPERVLRAAGLVGPGGDGREHPEPPPTASSQRNPRRSGPAAPRAKRSSFTPPTSDLHPRLRSAGWSGVGCPPAPRTPDFLFPTRELRA